MTRACVSAAAQRPLSYTLFLAAQQVVSAAVEAPTPLAAEESLPQASLSMEQEEADLGADDTSMQDYIKMLMAGNYGAQRVEVPDSERVGDIVHSVGMIPELKSLLDKAESESVTFQAAKKFTELIKNKSLEVELISECLIGAEWAAKPAKNVEELVGILNAVIATETIEKRKQLLSSKIDSVVENLALMKNVVVRDQLVDYLKQNIAVLEPLSLEYVEQRKAELERQSAPGFGDLKALLKGRAMSDNDVDAAASPEEVPVAVAN